MPGAPRVKVAHEFATMILDATGLAEQQEQKDGGRVAARSMKNNKARFRKNNVEQGALPSGNQRHDATLFHSKEQTT